MKGGSPRARRAIIWVAVGCGGLVLAAIVVLGMFPWGALKPTIERRLSDRIGRPVTIAKVERTQWFSLTPTVRIVGVRLPQPAWVGPGDLATVRAITVRFPAFPLLIGRFRPSALDISGVRLVLVRDARGRANWRGEDGDGESGGSPSLTDLRIRDFRVSYSDAVQDRVIRLNIDADRDGLRAAGQGTIRGAPVRLAVQGAAITGRTGRWPFRAEINGPALTLAVEGTMDRPLDTDHMALDVEARANDLKMVDAVIEAGLFGTQPVRLRAHARHDGPRWSVERLRGTIGRSRIAGRVVVLKEGERTKLSGSMTSDGLDFDDFASDAGRAAARAKERANGLKVVPDTRVNIAKIDRTDGTIDFDVRRIIGGRRPSSLTSMSGRVTLDHQLMTIEPFRIGLEKGAIAGTVTVDQRGGRRVPLVTLDLRLRDGSIGALFGGGDVDASLAGSVRLSGSGSTVREAVGRSDGTIGLVARDGALPARIAALIGFDLGRSLAEGKGERAQLRCAVARFDVRGGTARANPLIVDTSLSQSRAQGTLRFPDEALAFSVTGAPKHGSALRLPGSLTIAGTIRAPEVIVPREVRSVGAILKGLGRAITGKWGPTAANADCGALAAAASR